METNPKPDLKKALKFEEKGDKLVKKGKFREALAEFRKSEGLNPNRIEIYRKLIETLNRFEHEWKEEDFSNSMIWTMRRQELENPQIKWVHETFTLEYKEVQQLVQRLMVALDQKVEDGLIEKILTYGERATLPMLHFLLSIKALASQPPSESKETETPRRPPDIL